MLALNKQEKMVGITLTWMDLETGQQIEKSFEIEEEVSNFIDGLFNEIAEAKRKMPSLSLN